MTLLAILASYLRPAPLHPDELLWLLADARSKGNHHLEDLAFRAIHGDRLALATLSPTIESRAQ